MKLIITIAFYLGFQTLFAGDIEVAVHRGANRHAPENTFPAAHLAAELGGDFLEIDVRQNKDGVFFNFHDATIDRTTDGSGQFYDLSEEQIVKLDAGSWYRHSYKGERVPKVEKLIKEMKGKIKFYFDFKHGDIEVFIDLIRQWGVAKDCFFTLKKEDIQAVKDAGLDFKVNISNIEELKEVDEKWSPPIVEIRAPDLTDELVREAHDRGIKVMPYVPGDQFELYRYCLKFDIDMINLDNPDVFREMERTGKYPDPSWVAHRGGIVSEEYEEYNPEGIRKTFENPDYSGVEIDIWETMDGELVVHHDKDLEKVFGVDGTIEESTLKDLKKLESLNGGYSILTLEEYLELVPENAYLMPDIKTSNPDGEFYQNLEKIIEKRHSMRQCIFLGSKHRDRFWGQVRFSAGVDDIPEIFEKWKSGEDVACHYFLFDIAADMSPNMIRLAQSMSMEVIPGVNTFRYKRENYLLSGLRDIRYFRKLGVRTFQIDSVYDGVQFVEKSD
ncbi:glycerophosphodiester phosphodiesterase [Membranihabitans maritimus]|uniref:glycerophosphodiester phosphodiesterase n=1 Tax=Membranihabitans maritimus TaxID=2904244 RepID=UPI001F428064|nr:glycerophosphodiester phosphodiesterase family protein [Membranihabitans maritimus]